MRNSTYHIQLNTPLKVENNVSTFLCRTLYSILDNYVINKETISTQKGYTQPLKVNSIKAIQKLQRGIDNWKQRFGSAL